MKKILLATLLLITTLSAGHDPFLFNLNQSMKYVELSMHGKTKLEMMTYRHAALMSLIRAKHAGDGNPYIQEMIDDHIKLSKKKEALWDKLELLKLQKAKFELAHPKLKTSPQ